MSQSTGRLLLNLTSKQVESLWKVWYQPLYHWMVSKIQDFALAEELVQETFVLIHKGLPGLQDKERLSGCLLQMTRCVVAAPFRDLKRDQKTDAVVIEW